MVNWGLFVAIQFLSIDPKINARLSVKMVSVNQSKSLASEASTVIPVGLVIDEARVNICRVFDPSYNVVRMLAIPANMNKATVYASILKDLPNGTYSVVVNDQTYLMVKK